MLNKIALFLLVLLLSNSQVLAGHTKKCDRCDGNTVLRVPSARKCGSCEGRGHTVHKVRIVHYCKTCRGWGKRTRHTSRPCRKCKGKRGLDCHECMGKGMKTVVLRMKCSKCKGKPKKTIFKARVIKCQNCDGKKVKIHPRFIKCPSCDGKGRVPVVTRY